MEHLQYYWNWYCYANFFKSLGFTTLQSFDEAWRAKRGSISERNDNIRKALVEYYREYFTDRPDLVRKIMSTHAPQVRRKVVDNSFYSIIKQENVDRVTEIIDCITETGTKTKDCTERKFDMIVLGGFKVSHYFWPLDYKGRDGMTLKKAWQKDGARSYLGMTMPQYPHFFSFYGPNHQPRAGSLHSFGERWARYVVSAIVGMIEEGYSSIEIKKEVFDEYNARLDAGNKNLIWESGGSGYFVNQHGRQAVNMPWTNAEYHPMVRKVNFDDFQLK
ncbi:hypothetical protein BP5796_12428 [Coleophoma crateriformis]|uniref:Uncharacterized protein n=1 Tax=Coleophoma crateriformis TaxID=565419 RepID=A0A3D8QA58_9HELO|nr:hypothetical protein BP5796_12428 [Coleophoma crateriformis]